MLERALPNQWYLANVSLQNGVDYVSHFGVYMEETSLLGDQICWHEEILQQPRTQPESEECIPLAQLATGLL